MIEDKYFLETDKFIFIYIKPKIFFVAKNIEHNAQYAYYVFHNDEQIFTQWYSKKNWFYFDTQDKAGSYSIKWFVKFDINNNINQTRYFFLNIEKLELESNISEIKREILSSPQEVRIKSSQGFYYDLFYNPTRTKGLAKYLFVLFPGAIKKDDNRNIPFYHRISWMFKGMFPGAALNFADPSIKLYSDMYISWLVGNSKFDMIEEISEIVLGFAKNLNIRNENIIFYGSSQGGFTSLSLASSIEGSQAIVINPQTDIYNYDQIHLNILQKNCFPDMFINKDKYEDKFNMCKKWLNNRLSRIFYIQNTQDSFHLINHFIPFAKIFTDNVCIEHGFKDLGRFKYYIYSQNGGHIPETKQMCMEILTMAGIN